jgi:hypothetical protein
MGMLKIQGSCHCGYVTYEAIVDLEHIGICHCTDCQTLSGSAFRAGAVAPRKDFRLITGQPKIYIKTAQRGAKRVQAFCPECGTPIYSAAADNPQTLNIRTGTSYQRDQLVPKAQIWCRSAQAWARGIGQGMMQFSEEPPVRV